MQTVDVEIFKNSVAFTLRMSKWNIKRKARLDALKAGSDRGMLSVSKLLIAAPPIPEGQKTRPEDEYEAIVSHQGETRNRITKMSVPSFFQKGICLVRTAAIPNIESYLNRRAAEQQELVFRFIEVYPQRIREAEPRLGDEFNSGDYPMVTALPGLFGISWNWIAFGVPDSLPKELFEAEKAKAQKVWAEATDQITLCLREGWKELMEAAVDRLTSKPGEEKKVFRDSLIGNIIDFMDTFNSRNITNDTELAEMITKTREILVGIKPDDVRKNENLRARLAGRFVEMQTQLDSMITNMPIRSFDFNEE